MSSSSSENTSEDSVYDKIVLIEMLGNRLNLPIKGDDASFLHQLLIDHYIDAVTPEELGEAIQVDEGVKSLNYAKAINFYPLLLYLIGKGISYFEEKTPKMTKLAKGYFENELQVLYVLRDVIPILKKIQDLDLRFFNLKKNVNKEYRETDIQFSEKIKDLSNQRTVFKNEVLDLELKMEKTLKNKDHFLRKFSLSEKFSKEHSKEIWMARHFSHLAHIFPDKKEEFIDAIKELQELFQGEIEFLRSEIAILESENKKKLVKKYISELNERERIEELLDQIYKKAIS